MKFARKAIAVALVSLALLASGHKAHANEITRVYLPIVTDSVTVCYKNSRNQSTCLIPPVHIP
jgi:hypothetical protein